MELFYLLALQLPLLIFDHLVPIGIQGHQSNLNQAHVLLQ
jgi:hypothetical protein